MTGPGGITIRLAVVEDSPLLYAWRNDPASRAASSSTREVPWNEHEAWLARVLESGDHRLYLAELADPGAGDTAVGTVRFDVRPDGASADVSINLNPDFRGMGLGLPVLSAAIATFDESGDEPLALHAVIRPANDASIRLFAATGFVPAGEDGTMLHFWRGGL